MNEIPFINPTITGIAVTNIPHLRLRQYPISVTEEFVKIPFIVLGKYKHPTGILNFSKEAAEKMLTNYNNKVSDTPVSIRISHQAGQPAIAWAEPPNGKIALEGDVMVAYVKPTTEEYLNLLKNEVYKYASVEFAPNYSSNSVTLENISLDDTVIALSDEEYTDLITLSDYRNSDGTYKPHLDGSIDSLSEKGTVITEPVEAIESVKYINIDPTVIQSDFKEIFNICSSAINNTATRSTVPTVNDDFIEFRDTLKHFVRSNLDELRISSSIIRSFPDISLNGELLFKFKDNFYYIDKNNASLLYNILKEYSINVDINKKLEYTIPQYDVLLNISRYNKENVDLEIQRILKTPVFSETDMDMMRSYLIIGNYHTKKLLIHTGLINLLK